MEAVLAAIVPAAVIAFGLTPAIRRLAVRWGAVDRPRPGHMHRRPVPYLGGLGMVAAFCASLLIYVHPGLLFFLHLHAPQDGETIVGILQGGLIVATVGAVDDLGEFWACRIPWLADAERHGLRPGVKLAGQVLAAVVLCAHGVLIYGMMDPFRPVTPTWLPFGWAAYPLTVFWVVAICNALNLVDGLDGLAAGIACIASGTLLLVALLSGDTGAAIVLCAALLGTSLGFLPWNFYPARIFMGDAGAMFLGFGLAATSVVGPLKGATLVALSVPVLAIGLPVLDTVLAVLRRWRAGRLVGTRDNAHVHNRLVDLGLGHRDTVLALYVISGWLGISALAIDKVGPGAGTLILLFVVGSVALGARLAGVLPQRPARAKPSRHKTSLRA